MATKKGYRVLLNQDWELEDLYEFPHALSQCYAFVYCLDSELQPRDRERINNALQEYPWHGGFSYVNIYTVLKNQVPIPDRPRIKSIQKSSPGWLDLLLNANVAYQLASAVSVLSGAATTALFAYKKGHQLITSISAQRRKAQIDQISASAAEIKAMNALSAEIAKNLGFKSLKDLHQQTGNPEVSLKLLMAHFRRMSVLADYKKSGKATLTLPTDQADKQ